MKINETHIMVVRKDKASGMLETELVPLKFEEQDKLDELEKYSNVKNVSGIDMFNATNAKGLGYLLQGYDFCDCVSGSYQCCPQISLKDVKEGYFANGRNFYNLLKSRTIPYCLSQKYKEYRQDDSIVAFSSRHIGWTSTKFELNKDLSIAYNTNFGYGYANYFTANLKYKDIDILPYSMWVHYYKADISQILRYTRTYCVANSEWEPALKFGCDVCNSMINNPSAFANEWLIGEVNKMVNGLRDIFNNHKSVIAVNESNRSFRELKSKEEIVLYKGEKMSGALSFIDKIKEIEKLNISMDSYIKEILDLNKRMIPELQEVINECELKLEKLNAMHEELLSKIAPVKYFVDNHINECAVNFLGNNDYSTKIEASSIMQMLSATFSQKEKQLKTLEKEEAELNSEIWRKKNLKETLSGFVNVIHNAMEKDYAVAA